MSDKDKQIEEISRDLAGCLEYDEWSAREYGETEVDTDATARKLYEQGYRKERQGEWIWGKLGGREARVCSLCGAGFTGENSEWIAKEHIYCPKCGARMKGADNDFSKKDGVK